MINFRYYLRLALQCVVLITCVITLNITLSWGWTANTSKIPAGTRRKLSKPTLISIGNRIKSTVVQTQNARKASTSQAAHILNGRESFLRNDANGTPVFMSGDAVDGLKRRMGKLSAGASFSDISLRFITSNSEFFRLADPAEELMLISVTTDSNGDHHVLYDQYYNGIPFHGNRLTVHLDSNRIPYAFNARYSPTPEEIDTGNVFFSAGQAVEKAVDGLSSNTQFSELNDFMRKLYGYEGPSAELVILDNPEFTQPRLVWHVVVRPNARDFWQYFIDARHGEIVNK